MNNLVQYRGSVAIYAACILASVVFAGLAQVFDRSNTPITLTSSMTQSRRPNRAWWILSLLVPLLLASFRWETGTDYPTYRYLYTALNHIDTFDQFLNQLTVTEPAFILLNYFTKALFNHSQMVFVLSALITWAFFYKAISDYHEKCSVMLSVFALLVLLFAQSLNIVRQMIAVSIVFFANRYIPQRKYGIAAAWLALAVSFHISSLVIIPFWLTYGDHPWKRSVRTIMFCGLIVLLFGVIKFRTVLLQLPLLGILARSSASAMSIGLGVLLLRMPILIPVLMLRKRLKEHDERNGFWIALFLFEIAFSHLGYINEVFNRISLYFIVSWIVLIPAMVRCMPNRNAQRGMGAYMSLALISLWYFNTVVNNFGQTLPYKSIFSAFVAGG